LSGVGFVALLVTVALLGSERVTPSIRRPSPSRFHGVVERSAGTLTFLFTDIEGSTRRWESDPVAMEDAVRRHDDLLRSMIAERGGRFVKQTGDGVFATFDDAGSAVSAAVAAQEGFASHDWASFGPLPVRMGVHSGTAVARADDYFGNEVNRTARLMAVAHGGQILVSGVTASLADADLGADVTLEDLGTHRLRDLSQPLQVYQVVTPALNRPFPPLHSLDGYPNNLPAMVSSFVGRTDDIAMSVDQLATNRLVSLTGAGGSGKTRLALQVAAEMLPRFVDGAWFVDLAGLTEPGLVPQETAQTLRLRELPGRHWLDVLAQHLTDRKLLLLLDNCEHLLESAAELVATLLAAAPDLKVLTTTREPLNVPGEVSWRVPTMQLPSAGASPTLDELLEYEAAQLFVERALAARPDLLFTDGDAPTIAVICRRLDGLPLALELAAARVRALSVDDIARNLGDRFTLLSGGSRTALPRHRTLEGAVAWSFELLDEDERELFKRLTVFNGGFDLDAAAAVGGSNSLAGVASLVEKSLLSSDPTRGETRYRMLETVAAFGHQQLGAGFAEARNAHLGWATALAMKAAAEMDGPDQADWLDRIAIELDNLRAAMQWSLDGGDPLQGMMIAGSLYRFWYIRAVREGRHWLEQFLEAVPTAPPEAMARVVFATGSLIQSQGENEYAAELLDDSLRIATELGEHRTAAYARHYLIRARWGRISSQDLRSQLDLALDQFRALGDPVGLALTLLFDALWHMQYGSVGDAKEGVVELTTAAEKIGAPQLLAHAAEIPAVLGWLEGDVDTAAPLLAGAAGHYLEIGNQQCAGHCLENAAGWSLEAGMPVESAILLGAASSLRDDTGIPTPVYESFLFDDILSRVREGLGDDFEAAWNKGQAMSMDEALTFVQELTASD
jgi:predicted ATPase/class 3 adenylate cyclase